MSGLDQKKCEMYMTWKGEQVPCQHENTKHDWHAAVNEAGVKFSWWARGG